MAISIIRVDTLINVIKLPDNDVASIFLQFIVTIGVVAVVAVVILRVVDIVIVIHTCNVFYFISSCQCENKMKQVHDI